MKKQLFIASIEALKKQYEKDLAISKFLGRAFEAEPENVKPQNQALTTAFVNILVDIMEDENNLIELFCFEFGFGAKTMSITLKDRLHYIYTPNGLYIILESLRIEKLKNELIEDI
jgi:hypothetical protein